MTAPPPTNFSKLQCPLCEANAHFFLTATQFPLFDYHQCNQCDLVFLDPSQQLPAKEEKERYSLHENNPNDSGYVNFLNQLRVPLNSYLKLNSRLKGLDFGCGPVPVLAELLTKDGYDMNIYDPFFFPNRNILQENCYDFITCTETMEHFSQPKIEFDRLKSYLMPQGYLGLMTKVLDPNQDFNSWYYRRDPTHISFFSAASLQLLAKNINMKIVFSSSQVIILETNI